MLKCVKNNGHCHVIRLHDDSKMTMKFASLCVLKNKPITSSLLLMLVVSLANKTFCSLTIPHTCWLNSLCQLRYEVEMLSCLSTVLYKYLLKISGLMFRLLLRSGRGCCTTPLPPWSHSTVLGDEPGTLKWTYLRCIMNMEGLSATYRLVGYTVEFRLVWFISCLKFSPSCLPSFLHFLPSFFPSFLCSSSCCLNIFILRNAMNFLTSLARSACVILDYWIWPPLLLLNSPARVFNSVSNLFRALNLLRIQPSICTESCDTSITIQTIVLLTYQ